MKRRLWLAAKAVLTVVLLAAVLHRVDLSQLPETLGGLGAAEVAGALVLTAASVLVATWRWRRVLSYLGEDIAAWRLLSHNLVGATFNLILPTSVGGDVARAYRCARRARQADHAWASVAYERIMGLLSLVLVSSVGLLSTFSANQQELLVAALVMALGLCAVLAFAPAPLRLAARISHLGAARLGSALQRVAQAFAGPLAKPAARLETFGWSLLYQFVALSILLVVALGWDEPAIVRAVYLGVPIALVAATIPITIGGLGLRESLFVVLLEPFGLAAERAFALSIVWLASNVVVGLAGLLPVLLGDRD
jgi:uncharacterized protein (TIRG00374 family)